VKRTAVLLVLLLAGCGGSHHRKPPPTRAHFAAAADRVCAHARTRTAVIAGLRMLRPPKGGEDLYAHWLAAERDALKAATPTTMPLPKKFQITPGVVLAIDEGKIAGYARRLGATECARRAAGTLPP
jgi:hypothetical protein